MLPLHCHVKKIRYPAQAPQDRESFAAAPVPRFPVSTSTLPQPSKKPLALWAHTGLPQRQISSPWHAAVTDRLDPLHLLLQPGVLLHQPLQGRRSILLGAPAGVIYMVRSSPFHACCSVAYLPARHPCKAMEHGVTLFWLQMMPQSPGPSRMGVWGAVLVPHCSPASQQVTQVKALPPPALLGARVTHGHENCHARRHHQQPHLGLALTHAEHWSHREGCNPWLLHPRRDGNPAQEHPPTPAQTWALSPEHPTQHTVFLGCIRAREGLFGEGQCLQLQKP